MSAGLFVLAGALVGGVWLFGRKPARKKKRIVELDYVTASTDTKPPALFYVTRPKSWAVRIAAADNTTSKADLASRQDAIAAGFDELARNPALAKTWTYNLTMVYGRAPRAPGDKVIPAYLVVVKTDPTPAYGWRVFAAGNLLESIAQGSEPMQRSAALAADRAIAQMEAKR